MAIMAIGRKISVEIGVDSTKAVGSKRQVSRLAWCFDGWTKEDPPMVKKLPVEADGLKLLVKLGMSPCATEKTREVDDLTLIAYYLLFLLQIGEYTEAGLHSWGKSKWKNE